jgi:hypothetical protein
MNYFYIIWLVVGFLAGRNAVGYFKYSKVKDWSNRRRFYFLCWVAVAITSTMSGISGIMQEQTFMFHSFNALGGSLIMVSFTPCKFEFFKKHPGKGLRFLTFAGFGFLLIYTNFAL